MPAQAHSLLVTSRGTTRVFPLPADGEMTIGRAAECHVQLQDGLVSRVHSVLRVSREGREVTIEDTGSENGTFVFGHVAGLDGRVDTARSSEFRLSPHVAIPITPGMMIHIGGSILVVEMDGAPALARTRGDVVAVSAAMQRLLRVVDFVAPTEISVVLLGESGTGKEVMARAIHERSLRAKGPFLGINCGALPEQLMESELFGHEKGAFTGAASAKPGLLESARGGTVFLDEVGELAPQLQVKLLRVLEERTLRRVGALAEVPIDVRFVAATNRDLEAEVAAGRFRSDLYYRLNGVSLVLAPLRERVEDIEPLAIAFIEKFCRAHGRVRPLLSRAAVERLERQPWPGNARELKSVVELALALAQGPVVEPEHLSFTRRLDSQSEGTAPRASSEASPPTELAGEALREREAILAALDRCAGNQTRAARELGITRRALIARLDRYNIPRPRKR